MPNFDINSRFNKEANFSQVVFGEDGYVLETELNEMQHIQDEARASLIREQIHSGVLNYFEPTFLPTTPNAFKLEQEMKVNVNGQILTIPKDTMIQMNEPPTKDFQSVTGKVGYREDLVFLEAWKEEIDCTETVNKFGGEGAGTVPNTIKDGRVGVETTRRIQWKWRIRIVDDVDFVNYTDGFVYSTGYGHDGSNPAIVRPQGNNPTPVDFNNSSTTPRLITSYRNASKEPYNQAESKFDKGLYIAGTGTPTTQINCQDGYSYAIPLFRVKRRNSGGYSVENGNGAREYYGVVLTDLSLDRWDNGYSRQVNVDSNSYSKMQVGDKFRVNSLAYPTYGLQVKSKDGNNKVTLLNICDGGYFVMASANLYLHVTNRPDLLFNNIIDKRDIIDLRHKVSLTGFNYQELLEENFDKLLRGELNTKDGKKMLKTYHGIRKTPIDSNTVFYASMDGTIVPEVGNESITKIKESFLNTPTSLGLYIDNTGSNGTLKYSNLNISEIHTVGFTIDCVINIPNLNHTRHIFGLYSDTDTTRVCVDIDSGHNIQIWVRDSMSDNEKSSEVSFLQYYSQNVHLRLTYNGNNNHALYLNGNKVINFTSQKSLTSFSSLNILIVGNELNLGYKTQFTLSDLSISNIDRGDTFATLPKDFIDGYAVISPAFTDQRTTYGDPLMSQFTQEVIKCSGETKKQYTITKAGANWSSGDTIKVKGLTGEVITGVIDSDTALARVVSICGNSEPNSLIVDSVTGLSVGDSVKIYTYSMQYYTELPITSISGNKLTFPSTVNNSQVVSGGYGYLFEITASSSSPVLKYMNGTTITNVAGTWTGLGTNECTFTFGTNATLTNQDLEIQYSLNAPQGQGGISEVLTETLGGEYLGQKLSKQSSLVITDDFSDKVSGSNLVCPHSAYATNTSTGNLNGSYKAEFTQNGYTNIGNLDGLTDVTASSGSGMYPKLVCKFDIVKAIESKFGEIPILDKVYWCRTIVRGIKIMFHGYGVCPSGNKACINILHKNGTSTFGESVYTGNDINNRLITSVWSHNSVSTPEAGIDDLGIVTALIYTDPSDDKVQSVIRTNYVSFEVELKTESGFDVVAPENTRRDAGKSGVLLVRKETKEVRRYPLGSAKESSQIATYGDYLPKQTEVLTSSYSRVINPYFLVASSIGSGGIPKHNTSLSFKNICDMFDRKVGHLLVGHKLSNTYSANVSGCIKKMFLTTPHNYNRIGAYADFDDSITQLNKEPFVVLTPYLGISNNALYLCVRFATSTVDSQNSTGLGGGETYCFKLSGSPLVKEVF